MNGVVAFALDVVCYVCVVMVLGVIVVVVVDVVKPEGVWCTVCSAAMLVETPQMLLIQAFTNAARVDPELWLRYHAEMGTLDGMCVWMGLLF